MPKLESSNDPSKDKVERSSQADQLDDMLDRQLGLTEEEAALDPDREGLDIRSQKTTELIEREPEIKVIEDKRPSGDVVDDTPLAKALKTIEEQGNRLQELEARTRREPETETRRSEPQVEMIEILPNLRLPKDSSRWPIKITDRDLVALGWNEETKGPAQVLNILGNALYMFALETIPEFAGRAFETRLTERENSSKGQQAFEGLYPHLAKHRDIVSLVERNERQNPSSSLRGKYGQEYYQELGRLGEAKIADIRGITVEQYHAEAVSRRSTVNSNAGKSRAVTTGGSVRSTSQRKSDFEKDSEDL